MTAPRPTSLLALTLAVAACGGGPAGDERAESPSIVAASSAPTAAGGGGLDATVTAVPHPDLASLEPAVAAQIGALRGELERAETGADPRAAARAYGELGRAYHAYELFDAAAACYRRAAALDPADARWSYLGAVVAQRRGRLDESASLLRSTLERQPRSAPALLRLGNVELDSGRAAAARQCFESALADRDGQAAALYGLGRVAAAESDWPAARDFFQRVLEAQPAATIVQYALGQTYRELGDEQEARRRLALAGPQPVRFHDDEVASVEALATGAGAHLLAGGRALARGDHQTAIAEHRLAARVDPSSAEAALGLAFSCLRAGDHAAEAKAALGDAVRLAPDRAYVRYAAGSSLAALGELDEAERNLERALELDPTYLEARLELGRVLLERGRDADALRELTAALEVDPARVEAQLWVADALARAGAWDDAVVRYDAVLKLDPRRGEVWVRKATALFVAARFPEARGTLERGLAELPDDALLLTAAARFFASCPDPGLRDGQRALALAKDLFARRESVENAELVAMAQAEVGAFDEAVAWQRRALEAATAAGENGLAAVLSRNLERYRAGRACCAE
jgi:tetratricopeptide (TPR) repeat protein